MNKVILIGNTTKDIEINTTSNGIAVARFTVAVQRKFANADGEKETDFINCVVWRTLAENCAKYLKKGSKCAVVGELQTRSYEAEDGTKRYVTEVVASEVEFLSTKKAEDNAEPVTGTITVAPEPTQMIVDDDDLPF